MNSNEDKVRSIISKVLKLRKEVINLEDDLVQKYNMDSMQRVEIVIELENTFDIVISDEASVELRTVQQIIEFLNQVVEQK